MKVISSAKEVWETAVRLKQLCVVCSFFFRFVSRLCRIITFNTTHLTKMSKKILRAYDFVVSCWPKHFLARCEMHWYLVYVIVLKANWHIGYGSFKTDLNFFRSSIPICFRSKIHFEDTIVYKNIFTMIANDYVYIVVTFMAKLC